MLTKIDKKIVIKKIKHNCIIINYIININLNFNN